MTKTTTTTMCLCSQPDKTHTHLEWRTIKLKLMNFCLEFNEQRPNGYSIWSVRKPMLLRVVIVRLLWHCLTSYRSHTTMFGDLSVWRIVWICSRHTDCLNSIQLNSIENVHREANYRHLISVVRSNLIHSAHPVTDRSQLTFRCCSIFLVSSMNSSSDQMLIARSRNWCVTMSRCSFRWKSKIQCASHVNLRRIFYSFRA